jgi:hypothetical protein
MALKLLETKFIKDAWFGNYYYQTWLCLRKYHLCRPRFRSFKPRAGKNGYPESHLLGGQTLENPPLIYQDVPSSTVGSGYDGMLTEPRQLQALDSERGKKIGVM